VTYNIPFYGELKKEIVEVGGMKMEKSTWHKTETVKAMAYDTPIIGYNTFNTNCLRLWSALPSFD
jgi:glycogen phosphorylase